jgi:hypothetical protein
MSKETRAIFFDWIIETARRDRRKAAIVGLASFVLLVLFVHFIFRGPNSSPAAILQAPTSDIARVETPALPVVPSSEAINEWLKQPQQSAPRNAFALNLDDYPTDSSSIPGAASRLSNDQKEQALWDDVAKSLSAQADQKREREFRTKNLQNAASRLSVQNIVLGPPAKAQVNGETVEEGSFVGSLHVLRIGTDRITVERDGISVEVPVH